MMNTIRLSPARLAALAMGSLLASGAALAQNVADGQALFGKVIVSGTKSCTNCHGGPMDSILVRGADAARIKGATMAVSQMKPLHGSISDQEFNNLAAYLAKGFGVTPTYLAVTAAPAVSVSTTALTFASQNLATTSPAQTITVSNATGATGALTLASIAVAGGNDFTVTGGSCSAGGSVAAGANCTVNVVFKPTAVGDRSATLTITHNGAGGKSTVALSGAAVNTSPAVMVTPTTLTFAGVVAADTAPQRVTVSNTGTGPLMLSALTLGGSQSSDYRLIASSTCQAGGTVPGGSSCVADVVFTAGAIGARTGTLAIAHNAAGSPTAVNLNGTGTATPEAGVALDATAIDLGGQVVGMVSGPKTLTLTNSGGAPLVLGKIATSGTDAAAFVLGGTCASGESVPAKGSCTITVAMKPITLGAKTATLTVASNATTGAATVSLRGTGIGTPVAEVGFSQTAVGFGTVTFGTQSIGRIVTVTNTGTAALTVASINSSSTEFVSSHDCPASLAVSTSCTITIVYKPVDPSAAESVQVTTNAISSPNSIVVTGQGSATPLPVLAWKPAATSLKFPATVVGMSSASQNVTLANMGPGKVTLTSLGTAGSAASSFAIASASTCKVGSVLDVDATCSVTMNFVPGSTGDKVSSLQIGSTGTPPADVLLSGTGASPGSGSGALSVSASTLDFSSIVAAAGSSTPPLRINVTNGSSASVAISSINLTGPFSLQAGVGDSCPAGASTLAAGAGCTLWVVHTPDAAAASTGKLTISADGQTIDIALKGQAAAASTPQMPQSGSPVLMWGSTTPMTVQFDSTAVGKSTVGKAFMLTNQGPGAVTFTSVGADGTGKAAFTTTADTTCKPSVPLAEKSTCVVGIAFAPNAAGMHAATLRIASNGSAPADIALSGTGTSNSTPNDSTALTADFASLGFGGVMGKPSEATVVTLKNTGASAVTLANIGTSGPFQVVNSAADGCSVPQMLAPNATCVVSVVFVAPAATGDSTGTLTVSGAGGETRTVQLLGRAVVDNVGASSSDEDSGGGASDLLALAGLALLLLAAHITRRKTSSF